MTCKWKKFLVTPWKMGGNKEEGESSRVEDIQVSHVDKKVEIQITPNQAVASANLEERTKKVIPKCLVYYNTLECTVVAPSIKRVMEM